MLIYRCYAIWFIRPVQDFSSRESSSRSDQRTARLCYAMVFRCRLFFLLLSLFLILPSLAVSDLASDTAALIAFSRAVGGRTRQWDIGGNTTCNWMGVQCDGGRVTSLRLPAFTLSGTIPADTIGNLSELQTLSLRFNILTGSLPDLSNCRSLRNLYLQNNMFSGSIPSSLFNISNLTRLDLSTNNFTGSVSSDFNNLTQLRILFLQNNRFSGPLPNLNTSLTQFNASNNQLNGTIPDSFQSMNPNAFVGNSLCGRPLDSCPGSEPSPSPSPTSSVVDSDNNRLSAAAIAGIVIGAVVGIFLILLIIIFLRRKTGDDAATTSQIRSVTQNEAGTTTTTETMNNGNSPSSVSAPSTGAQAQVQAQVQSNGTKKLLFFNNPRSKFELEELLRASAEVLGKGVYATSYKASLHAGLVVAVKRLKEVTASEKEFKETIETLGSFSHENLLPLRAYYYSREEKLLVYDYMPVGSLSALLHGNREEDGMRRSNWKIRAGIALGTARAIEFIHSQGANSVHGNIKSSNIILAGSYAPLVSDFGLVGLSSSPAMSARVCNYRAPEITDPRKFTHKADVYGFGVLLMEMLTGKTPLMNDEGTDLPRWVQSITAERWNPEVFDVELRRNRENDEEEMVHFLQLAVDCAALYPDKRPSISDVVTRIEELHHLNGGAAAAVEAAGPSSG